MRFLFRRSIILLACAMAVIALGLALRLIPSGLPPLLIQYGGSVLWAAMVYLLLAVPMPAVQPRRVAAIACAISAIVELTRLYHTPAFDAFRLTLAGKLLLGRVFNPSHFPIYWATIAAVALLDTKLAAGTAKTKKQAHKARLL
ncbi:MAG TPA: DUF2809 domain-containing protein [Acidobacteriaceae bacterium]|nr:DUF2809 domain-containing protein [Acidobacteriaceae bacterium]